MPPSKRLMISPRERYHPTGVVAALLLLSSSVHIASGATTGATTMAMTMSSMGVSTGMPPSASATNLNMMTTSMAAPGQGAGNASMPGPAMLTVTSSKTKMCDPQYLVHQKDSITVMLKAENPNGTYMIAGTNGPHFVWKNVMMMKCVMNFTNCSRPDPTKPCKCSKTGNVFTGTLKLKVDKAMNNQNIMAVWRSSMMGNSSKSIMKTVSMGMVKAKCGKKKPGGGSSRTTLVSLWLNLICLALANLVSIQI